MAQAPPLATLRALEAPPVDLEGAASWRWAVDARFTAPVAASALRSLVSGAWVASVGANRAVARVHAPRLGRPAAAALELLDETTLCEGVSVEWDLLSAAAPPPAEPLQAGGWVIVRGRAEDADSVPDEAAFQQRLATTIERLQPIGAHLICPSLPTAIAAERARGLQRLRRAWDSRVLIRLLAPGSGWQPARVWGLLTAKLGLSALPEGRLGYLPEGGGPPIFDAQGWDGGEVVHHGQARDPSCVQGLELSFKPATQPQPEAVLGALLEVAAYLQAELGGLLLDEEEEGIDERLLREGVRVVVAGLASHGLRPGAGPTRLLAQRPQARPPALQLGRRA